MSMHDGALLSMSPEGLRAAVGPSASNNPNRRNIVRQFVSALNNDYEARSERRSGDRAAKRRADSSARRPSPTTVAVSDMASRQELLYGPLIGGRVTHCTLSVRPSLRLSTRNTVNSSTLVETFSTTCLTCVAIFLRQTSKV